MPAPPIRLRLVGKQPMSFLRSTAKKFRIPMPVVERTTAALLQLLQRYGRDADVAALVQGWAEMAALLARRHVPTGSPGLLTRLGTYVFAMPSASRNAKAALLHAGLVESELVPFVAAFCRHALEHTDDATLTRLIVRVPGLTRLCRWPLAATGA